jgi:hypothetical protein
MITPPLSISAKPTLVRHVLACDSEFVGRTSLFADVERTSLFADVGRTSLFADVGRTSLFADVGRTSLFARFESSPDFNSLSIIAIVSLQKLSNKVFYPESY